MLDPRLPNDTLFITFEQDFRWYERDCLDLSEWLPMAVTTTSSQLTEQPPGPPAGAPPSLSQEDEHRRGSTLKLAQQAANRRGSAERVLQGTRPVGISPVAKEIFELVSACNIAHRHKKGALVWFGYNVAEKKGSSHRDFVGYGSQGVCFTKPSAEALRRSMQQDPPQLFDMWLKNLLTNNDFSEPEQNWRAVLGESSFVSPPLGGFYEHVTEIVGQGKTRPSLFGAAWGQEGSVGASRPTDVTRRLMAFPLHPATRSTPGTEIVQLQRHLSPENGELFWKTMMPPPSWEWHDATFRQCLEALDYVDEWGYYRGPKLKPWPAEGWYQHRATGRWTLREDPQLKALRDLPDEPWVERAPLTTNLSRLAQKVVALDLTTPQWELSARDRRRTLQRVTEMGWRCLVEWQSTREVSKYPWIEPCTDPTSLQSPRIRTP